MLLLASTLALSFLGSFVNAQATNDTALGIAAIEAHFSNAKLVPDLLPTFAPLGLLSAVFPTVGEIKPGQNLTTEQSGAEPQLLVIPANSSASLTGSNCTVIMADADIVGTDESKGQTRHWLVNSATLSTNSSGLTVSTAGGVAITDYAGPGPASGSGPHRYVIMVFQQPSAFAAPANLSTPGVAVSVFNLQGYITESKLGPLVAAIYFTVEVGTATVTIAPTSPVVSSTLKPNTPSTTTATGNSSSSTQTSTRGSNAATQSGNSVLAVPAAVLVLLASYIYL